MTDPGTSLGPKRREWPRIHEDTTFPGDPLILHMPPPPPEAGHLAAATYWQRRAAERARFSRYIRDIGLHSDYHPRSLAMCIDAQHDSAYAYKIAREFLEGRR